MNTTRDCELCPHPWLDHDGMGDCHHLDRRTKSGYCAGHESRTDITEESGNA
ncbi:hypothetical protein [Nocardia sp. NPDC049149]|uniref:hypothetical protein n=1 Tax=Nocardia sp. NPDC049149 TaxID=3364315 RepID=UPI00371322A7